MSGRLPPVHVEHPHVELREDSLGSPFVRGSRVPVRRLWAWHRKGVSVETLVKRYPALGWAKVLDGLGFAYDNQELVEADLDRERHMLENEGAKGNKGTLSSAVPGAMEQTRLPFDPGSGPATGGPGGKK